MPKIRPVNELEFDMYDCETEWSDPEPCVATWVVDWPEVEWAMYFCDRHLYEQLPFGLEECC